jgi:hypothetical protein
MLLVGSRVEAVADSIIPVARPTWLICVCARCFFDLFLEAKAKAEKRAAEQAEAARIEEERRRAEREQYEKDKAAYEAQYEKVRCGGAPISALLFCNAPAQP